MNSTKRNRGEENEFTNKKESKDSNRKMRAIVQAEEKDKEEILRLYKTQLGREFCPWDETYPGEKEIEFDLSRDALFVMKDEKGKIIASISIDEDEAVEKLECWTPELQPGKELSRLAVDPDYQNHGLAREMLQYGMQVLYSQGYKSVHFLVNRHNKKALRSYEALNFQTVGECELYDQPFLCYEKVLIHA